MDDDNDAVLVVNMAILLVSFLGFQPLLLQTTGFVVSEILLPGVLKVSEWIVGLSCSISSPGSVAVSEPFIAYLQQSALHSVAKVKGGNLKRCVVLKSSSSTSPVNGLNL